MERLCMNCKHFRSRHPKSMNKGMGWCRYNEREISQWCTCGLNYEPKKEGGK